MDFKWIAYTRRKLTDLSFSVKLFIGFLFFCLIPILIVSHIYFSLAKSNIQSNSTDFIRLFATQLQTTINNSITQIENTSLGIFSDHQIVNYLGHESDYTTSAKINHYLQINRRLNEFADQLPFVEGVMLISTEGKIYTAGVYSDSYERSVLSQQSWYRQIQEANGQLVITPAYLQRNLSGRVINLFAAGRLIKDQNGQGVGVLLFNLTASSLIIRNANINDIRRQYDARIIIANKQNQLIYDSAQEPSQPSASPSIPYDLQDPAFVTIVEASDSFGVDITVMVPKDKLYRQVDQMKSTTILIVILSTLIAALCSIGLSLQLTKPIYALTRNMNHVEQGYYQAIHTERNDEIGLLIKKYNLMILQIKHLIEDVYKAKIRQNEARFLALQNQINPHWLNNTLESIRMKAHNSGAKEVALMIKTLGKLFHLALNHNPQANRLHNEIEYIELYVFLQNIRYENLFSLVVEIDESLLQIPILNLVFQPIIENSIMHGFWDDSKHYHITIRSAAAHGATVIQIIDDGEGISPDQLSSIFHKMENQDHDEGSTGSIGLRNVHERIQLHYGAQYGLTIQSSIGKGTVVSIMLPPAHQS